MGICCEPSDNGDSGALKDLEPLSVAGLSDEYQVWEYQTAFALTNILAFKQAVNAAHEVDGEQGFVTLPSLREQLTTKAWAGLGNPGSKLGKLLLSDAFKNKKDG